MKAMSTSANAIRAANLLITHAVNCYRSAESAHHCYQLPPYVSVNKHHDRAAAYFYALKKRTVIPLVSPESR
jgi:hypothetical protein